MHYIGDKMSDQGFYKKHNPERKYTENNTGRKLGVAALFLAGAGLVSGGVYHHILKPSQKFFNSTNSAIERSISHYDSAEEHDEESQSKLDQILANQNDLLGNQSDILENQGTTHSGLDTANAGIVKVQSTIDEKCADASESISKDGGNDVYVDKTDSDYVQPEKTIIEESNPEIKNLNDWVDEYLPSVRDNRADDARTVTINAYQSFNENQNSADENGYFTPSVQRAVTLTYDELVDLTEFLSGKEDWQTEDHNIEFKRFDTEIKPGFGKPKEMVTNLNPYNELAVGIEANTTIIPTQVYNSENPEEVLSVSKTFSNHNTGIGIVNDTNLSELVRKTSVSLTDQNNVMNALSIGGGAIYGSSNQIVTLTRSDLDPAFQVSKLESGSNTIVRFGKEDSFRRPSTPSTNNGGNGDSSPKDPKDPKDPWDPDPSDPYNPKDEQETLHNEPDGNDVVGEVNETR